MLTKVSVHKGHKIKAGVSIHRLVLTVDIGLVLTVDMGLVLTVDIGLVFELEFGYSLMVSGVFYCLMVSGVFIV